jgi:competence CoiA-like predicted nuclease
MQFAINRLGAKIEAHSGLTAFCPSCQGKVIPKCGRIRVHHWAHSKSKDCDPWFEPETEWHRAWKNLFSSECVEVPLGPHRADIRNNSGVIIELQNSAISPSEIEEREQFYQHMIWLVNAQRFASRFFLMKRLGGGLYSFKWKYMKHSWRYARKPVYLDFGQTTAKDLLGSMETDSSEFFTAEGELQYFERKTIRRVSSAKQIRSGTPEIKADACLDHSVFLLKTMHSNGWGSVKLIDERKFKQQIEALT